MSRLDDIKDQVSAQFAQYLDRIQESTAYNNLKDRYDNLSPSGQKLALYGSVFLLVLILVMPPLSHYRAASENVLSYEEKQQTIRDLLRVSRETGEGPDIFPPPAIESLKSQVEGYLKMVGVLPSQIRSVSAGMAQGGLIPRDLASGVLEVNLAKLNIKQIIDVGHKLSTLATAAKLKDMNITANMDDARYFDVNFTIYTLKVPEKPMENTADYEEKPKKSSRGKGGADE